MLSLLIVPVEQLPGDFNVRLELMSFEVLAILLHERIEPRILVLLQKHLEALFLVGGQDSVIHTGEHIGLYLFSQKIGRILRHRIGRELGNERFPLYDPRPQDLSGNFVRAVFVV